MAKKDKIKAKNYQKMSKPKIQKGGQIKTVGFSLSSNAKLKIQLLKPIIRGGKRRNAIVLIILMALGSIKIIYP